MGKSYRSKLGDAFQREIVLIAMLIGCVAFSILLVLYGDRFTWGDLVFEVILSVGAAAITIILVDMHHQKDSDKMLKESMKDLILVEKESLVNHFSKNDNKRIISNCLDAICTQEMSKSFMGFVTNNLQTARKNFNYDIYLTKSTENDDEIIISQEINYIRMFRTEGRTEFKLKCLFALSSNALDKTLNDKSYFFREQFNSLRFIEELRTIVNQDVHSETELAEKICQKLNLKLSLKPVGVTNADKFDVPVKDIKAYIDENDCISLEYEIPEKYLSFTEDKGQCVYRAYLSCCYPMKKENHFYCVFPEPTIGMTSFSINFNDVLPDVQKNVEYLTFLSSYAPLRNDSGVSSGDEIESHAHYITFKTSNSIYPRSGIVFIWNNK